VAQSPPVRIPRIPACLDIHLPPGLRPRKPPREVVGGFCASIFPTRVTTSQTASRPPGCSTRKASRNTRSLSAERLITQFEMITSTELSEGNMLDSPFKNSTLLVFSPFFFFFSFFFFFFLFSGSSPCACFSFASARIHPSYPGRGIAVGPTRLA